MTESDILRIWNGPTSQCNKARILKFAADLEAKPAEKDCVSVLDRYESGVDMGYTLALGIVTSTPDRTATGCARAIMEEMERRRMSRVLAAHKEPK